MRALNWGMLCEPLSHLSAGGLDVAGCVEISRADDVMIIVDRSGDLMNARARFKGSKFGRRHGASDLPENLSKKVDANGAALDYDKGLDVHGPLRPMGLLFDMVYQAGSSGSRR